MTGMQKLYLLVPLAPLFGAIMAGLFGKIIGRRGAHTVTIAGVAAAFALSVIIFQDVQAGNTFQKYSRCPGRCNEVWHRNLRKLWDTIGLAVLCRWPRHVTRSWFQLI